MEQTSTYIVNMLRERLRRRRWDVLSPDGFSINAIGTYRSRKKAIKAFEQWKKNFERQGYYSTIQNGERVRIPLDDLHHYCRIIKVK